MAPVVPRAQALSRQLTIHPAEVTAHSPVGGKARALASAQSAGMPVPAWFVVTPDAFDASLTPAERCALTRLAGDADGAGVAGSVVPASVVSSAIRQALAGLCPNGEPVALRSSADAEDGSTHSMAGQLESLLLVAPEDVCTRIPEIWRSGFSARLLAYRRHLGVPGAPSAPAVIVQRMVRADTSGIAFSADPVTGRRGVAVVSAVRGDSAALASGACDGDTWHVDRSGHIVGERVIGAAPSLSSDEVRSVASLARQVAAHFGRPQDIEWAFEDGALRLLQSRPITALAGVGDPDGAIRVWDNSNIVESYSGVTTPLTYSFAADVYEHVYRQFCRLMRVRESAITSHDDAFRNMLGLIRGRMYYNLGNWYRVLALLPGFSINRRFMEQMMGVDDALSEESGREVQRGIAGRLRDMAQVSFVLAALITQHLTIGSTIAAFRRRLDTALSPPCPPLSDRTPDELVSHYRALRRQLLLAWDAPIVNDFFAMVFHGALRRLSQAWCGDAQGSLQNALVSGQGGLVSAEPATRLQRLAQIANADPALASLLESGSCASIADAIGRHPGFDAEYRAYLDKFGDRVANELKLETVTLHEDPRPLLRAIGRLARPQSCGHEALPGVALRDSRAAEARVAAAMTGRPLRRLAFNWVLTHARARVRDRENLRLERTRLFGRVRRIFVELGRRLHDAGALDEPRDVFYLTTDEVIGFVEGRSVCTSLRELVGVRRREFTAYEQAPAPDDRFETRGAVYHGNDFRRPRRPETATSGDSRQGLGCCPGIVCGPVRIVTDPATTNLQAPSILVAEHTDPGWILLFPSALAVIVERGSLLSHAAIVARELGIPAIVSVPGVVGWLTDGDWVEMDGQSGTVRRLAAPPTSSRTGTAGPPDASNGAHACC